MELARGLLRSSEDAAVLVEMSQQHQHQQQYRSQQAQQLQQQHQPLER